MEPGLSGPQQTLWNEWLRTHKNCQELWKDRGPSQLSRAVLARLTKVPGARAKLSHQERPAHLPRLALLLPQTLDALRAWLPHDSLCLILQCQPAYTQQGRLLLIGTLGSHDLWQFLSGH